MSDTHGIIGIYRKGGSMTETELFNNVINIIYEDNFSHVDFMDNMGGDCDCQIHNVLNFLHDYKVYSEC
jgi:hypothetical protein